MQKIRQVKIDGDQIKICYQVGKHCGDDKHTLESKEAARPEFGQAFAKLGVILAAISGIEATPKQINLTHDDEGITKFTLVGIKDVNAPFTGSIEIKTPEILTEDISTAEYNMLETVEAEAGEYLKGNRAQLSLIFG
jgi:hypothetical protein